MTARWFVALCTVATAAALCACSGGGTDGTGAVPAGLSVVSSGAMTKGSVILNGARYDETMATVTDDRNRTATQLANGMVIKLRGRSDDGVNGVAERINVENEVRAPIQSIDAAADPQRFTVAGLNVSVDAQTVYANVAGFASLATGMRVEVHGLRDAAGLLHATRVEAVGAQDGANEVRGAISNINTAADQFVLNGNLTVSYAGAVLRPAGTGESALVAGAVVEVRGNLIGTVFTATQIDVEDLEDNAFLGSVDEKEEVEGFVSGFTAHPGAFLVNARRVQTTAGTQFEDGAAADLADDVKAEAEGAVNAQGVLVASKIKFKRDRVIVEGLATSVNVAARTLVVLNQTVRADDLTRIDARVAGGGKSSLLVDIAPNIDCVEVRGFFDGTRLVAERIKESSNCNRDLVQARVTGENEANATLTFFGNLTAVLQTSAEFKDDDDDEISRTAFFAAVTPAGPNNLGTLVKVRGTFASGTLNAEEAEIKK